LHTPEIPVLGKVRQEDHEFEASLGSKLTRKSDPEFQLTA
jgi:hypothetical protein